MMRPTPSLGDPAEWKIGNFPMDAETEDHPSWPDMTWNDLLICFDATPSSPLGRYVIMVSGVLYTYNRKVVVRAFVKYARDIRMLFSADLKRGGRLDHMTFEEQVQAWFDMEQEPIRVVGWAVKSFAK